jgi:hypothetical protein
MVGPERLAGFRETVSQGDMLDGDDRAGEVSRKRRTGEKDGYGKRPDNPHTTS